MLTGKQDLFCREYLKDLNAYQAALRAGYAPTSAEHPGRTLLADPEVQERIAELNAERIKQLQLDANEVLREVREIALADPADAYNPDGTFKRLHDIPPALRKTIGSIKTREIPGVAAEVVEVKFWDKTRALDMLMRHLSLYRDTLELKVDDDTAERIVRARRRVGKE